MDGPQSVEWSPSHMAHQLVGYASCVSGSETLSTRPKRSPCVGAHRQHSGGLLHQPLRRSAVTPPVQAGAPDPWVKEQLRAVYIPGHLNVGADILSRPREWMLHTEVVKQIWRVFGQAQVDLFATRETPQCPLWYSLTHPAPLGLDAMVQTWQRLHLYTFPPITLLPGVLERVRRDGALAVASSPILAGPRMVFGPYFSPRRLFMEGGISSHRQGAPLCTPAGSCGSCGCGPRGGTAHSFRSLNRGCWDHPPI